LKILVDTTVWIDFFNGVSSPHRVSLRRLIEAEEEVCISGYILAETLQGFKDDKEFEAARTHLLHLPILDLTLPDSYTGAARLYRTCRKAGVTIRKTADCLIAQTAIEHDVPLLHNDKDFDRIASVSGLEIFPT
jgi:predicted nucleic acid-binding protein